MQYKYNCTYFDNIRSTPQCLNMLFYFLIIYNIAMKSKLKSFVLIHVYCLNNINNPTTAAA